MHLLLKLAGVLVITVLALCAQPVAGDVKRLAAQRAAVETQAAFEANEARKAEEEAAYKLMKEEQARVAAIKRAAEKKQGAATLARVKEEVQKMNPYSNRRDSYKWHVASQFIVKARAAPSFCMSLPAAETHTGFRNGMAVILAPCNISDATQHFSYDPTSKFIHPEANTAFCLDFEFDNKDLRPLTAFRCDKTFSSAAKPRHQEWEFFNTSNIKNSGTKKCVSTGKTIAADKWGFKKTVYEGKAVQQYDCGNHKEQWWTWIPKQWYKAQHSASHGWVV